MLHWHQIWKHMRKLTGKEIEKRALMEIINYFEDQIDVVIKQSVIELDKINELNKIQGLEIKKRIDRKCIRGAIKTINSNNYSYLPEKTGGKLEKKEKINEKHLPKKDFFTEVT